MSDLEINASSGKEGRRKVELYCYAILNVFLEDKLEVHILF